MTHFSGKEHISKHDIEKDISEIKQRLAKDFSDSDELREELNKILDELTDFELGRFLIKNQGGLSGYWTYYIIINYTESTVINPTEQFILTKSPGVLATRERFGVFVKLLQVCSDNYNSLSA